MALTIITKPTDKEISARKMETYEKYGKIIIWGRTHPTAFVSRFMGVELLDFQKYIIENSWNRDFALWLISRNGSKSY